MSNYASASYDKVVAKGGKTVGLSMFAGYSYNERSMLSLGVVDHDVEIGTEVTLVWGEEGGGTKKTTVERHKQMEIRAIVSPVPYSKVAREDVRGRLAHRQGVVIHSQRPDSGELFAGSPGAEGTSIILGTCLPQASRSLSSDCR